MVCIPLGLAVHGHASRTWSVSLPRGWPPTSWERDHQPEPSVRVGLPDEAGSELSVSAKRSRAAWARLINKVYDANPLRCARCHSPMKIIAVITDPAQVLRILRYLIKAGKSPPGLDPASFN